jgi:hypothetical protein
VREKSSRTYVSPDVVPISNHQRVDIYAITKKNSLVDFYNGHCNFIFGIIAIYIFYQATFHEEEKRLSELVKSQSGLIESITRFNKKYDSQYPGGAKTGKIRDVLWIIDMSSLSLAEL